MRALVVDDEPHNLDLVEQVLSEECEEIVSVPDGRSALDLVFRNPPDLVLLDVRMPGMDGLEVCRHLRKRFTALELPVIVITAEGDAQTRIRGKELGVDEFLTKPFDHRELVVRVRALAEKKRLFEERERERRAALEDANRLREQLLRADRLATLGTLAGSVGHELNNIVGVLGSAVQALARGGSQIDPELLADLSLAREHVAAHAHALLTLGRPGRRGAEPVDVVAKVHEVVAMAARSGRTRFVDVHVRATRDAAPALVEPTKLEQVLLNLLVNASDALAASRNETPRILVTIGRRGGRLVCAIRDNAGGIPVHVLPRIFEPYFTTKEPGKGTGLGLPVVRQIVESYGGELHVDTAKDRGTTFSFDLPIAAEGYVDARSRVHGCGEAAVP